MAGFHVLDGAELRLQGHGGLQAIRGRRAHGRIGFVTVQADARTGQFEVDFRTGQRRRGVGEVANLRRNAGFFHTTGEVLERFDLHVGGGNEFRNVRRVGDRQMAPLADDMQHAFLGERHQFGERRVETGGREAVTAEAGIDLHMHARRLAKPACGRGDTVDAGERADGNVDVVVDQLVERHFGAAVDPRQNMAAIGADAGFAQQQRLMRLRGAEPCGAACERGERGGDQTVAVRVGFDDAHDGGAGMRTADDTHQMAHVVAQCGEVDDGLRRIPPLGGLVVRFALFGGEIPFTCCAQSHGSHCRAAL